jgi:hypothetical protein
MQYKHLKQLKHIKQTNIRAREAQTTAQLLTKVC